MTEDKNNCPEVEHSFFDDSLTISKMKKVLLLAIVGGVFYLGVIIFLKYENNKIEAERAQCLHTLPTGISAIRLGMSFDEFRKLNIPFKKERYYRNDESLDSEDFSSSTDYYVISEFDSADKVHLLFNKRTRKLETIESDYNNKKATDELLNLTVARITAVGGKPKSSGDNIVQRYYWEDACTNINILFRNNVGFTISYNYK